MIIFSSLTATVQEMGRSTFFKTRVQCFCLPGTFLFYDNATAHAYMILKNYFLLPNYLKKNF